MVRETGGWMGVFQWPSDGMRTKSCIVPKDGVVAQMTAQLWGVCTTLVWSGIGSAILYKVVDVIVGLRVNVETEREGLDVTEHTERAYNM